MKKIILPITIAFVCMAPAILNAQGSDYSLTNERKDLRHEKREIRKEERLARKDKHAIARTEVTWFTKESFRNDFPNASDIAYSVGKNFDEVYYHMGDKNYIAYYDMDAKLVGTTSDSQLGDLPESAQREITRKYIDNGYDLYKVILFDDNEANQTDMWLYERPFADMDNYFVELNKADKKLILQVDLRGNVSFFKEMK